MNKNLISLKYKIALLRIGITQREAAKTLCFSESYISMLISGQRSNKKFDEWLFKQTGERNLSAMRNND